MAEFVLSRQAEADLLKIYEYTEITFGQYQAEAYHAGLERSFSLLADFPRMGTPSDHIGGGLRRFRFQSHYIFYSEDQTRIIIRALIHFRMNVRPDFFE